MPPRDYNRDPRRYSRCVRIVALGIAALLAACSPLSAQDLDLDSLVDAQESQAADPTAEFGPGDNKEFTVSTEDDVTALEKGDLYKNNGSLFKVISIASKGEAGGTFTLERIGGTNDPTPSWSRTSGSGPPSIITRESLWDLYLAAGWTMHGIAGCLFITIILGINGAWIYRRGKQCPPRFVEQAQDALQNRDFDRLHELAHYESGLLGSICRAMVTRFESSTLQDVSDRCELEAGRYVRMLRVPLNGLSLISAIAPLLGLLGTVIGIVTCFDTIAYEAASAGKSQALASGIRVALFTTVGGLTVAIPAQVVLFLSNLRLQNVVSECEFIAEQLLHEVALIKRAEEPAPVMIAAPPKRERRVTSPPATNHQVPTANQPPPPAAPEATPPGAAIPAPVAQASTVPEAASVEPSIPADTQSPVPVQPPAPVEVTAPPPVAAQQPPAAQPDSSPPARPPRKKKRKKKSSAATSTEVRQPAATTGGFTQGGLISNEEVEDKLNQLTAAPAEPQQSQPEPASQAIDVSASDEEDGDIEFGEWSE